MPAEYFFYTDKMDVGYDGKPLIRNIKMEVRQGEILTLIGPNGAGKSTILKSITQQLRLIGGTVYLDGKSVHQMAQKEIAKTQAVVLTTRMHPEMMTCRDVVGTGRYPYTGMFGILSDEDHEKVQQALETVHALDIAERDFEAISDGQRQRILLARAICQEPKLIILDEPTSFLDIKHKLEFLEILRDLVRTNGTTVIMSLHELDLAQKISDRVMCVHGPAIERYGAPEEIFTEEYIGQLYGMERAAYDAAFGCTELPPTVGTPKVFVIAGGGSGIPVYRKLQRKNIPFATGVLQKNDIDYEAARHLANKTISEDAFESIGEERFREAVELMETCDCVLCPLQTFRETNSLNKKLLELARKTGKLRETLD